MMAYRRIIYNLLRQRANEGEVFSVPGGVLAYMAGCHRRTVSRVIAQLEEDGVLRVHRDQGAPNCYQLR